MPKNFVFPSFVYAVTPDWTDTPLLLAQAEAALQGGVRILQYRDKLSVMIDKLHRGRALKALCLQYNAQLIINDDTVLALATDADGVHLGADDGNIRDARRLLPKQCIIGASCYNSLSRAQQAIADGASYVAFGACFDSPTKPAAHRIRPDQLADFRIALGSHTPICGIGGIRLDNVAQLIGNLNAVALISELFGSSAQPKQPETVRQLVQLFLQNPGPAAINQNKLSF